MAVLTEEVDEMKLRRRPEDAAGGSADAAGEGAPEEHLVSLFAPTSFAAEQYRILRHIVEERQRDAGLRAVAITSPGLGDGKTTTAVNLAGALAQAAESRVLLLEADLRRPCLVRHLGLDHPGSPGLVDAILDRGLSLDEVVRGPRRFNLALLPAGEPPSAPYEVLKSSRFGEILEEARRRYDFVVLDTPPLVPCPDYRLIEKWIDGTLLVVAAHRTPRKMVEAALDLADPAKIIGVVFNADDSPAARYHHTYYAQARSTGEGSGGSSDRKA